MASYMLEHIPYTLIRLISENGAKGVDIVIIADDVTRPSYKDFGVQVVKKTRCWNGFVWGSLKVLHGLGLGVWLRTWPPTLHG